MTRLDAIWFRRFRRSHKMTQKDLARVLGLNWRTIKTIESGKVRPRLSTVRKFEALVEKVEGASKRG